ncbi:MAG: ion transporter [Betaproteobacteria bacterium]|nr:ion transporter [Betaproteobacteria bacterium]
MLRRLADFLSEAVMGFLALGALAAGLAPLLFTLPAAVESVADVFEWAIVAAFALEFGVQFAVAADRGKYLRDPWHILDASIVVISVASLLPAVTDVARLSPALRILRLFRVLLFGMRAGHGVSPPLIPPPRAMPVGPPQVDRLQRDSPVARRGEWEDLLRWAASPTDEWIHASNLSPERLREAAQAAGVPHVLVEAALNESSYPRLETGKRWSALTLSVPSKADNLRRDPVLLLVSGGHLLSLAVHALELEKPPEAFGDLPWGTRCALDVVRRVIGRSEELAGRLEREVRELESLPADESPDRFFEATFRLKRALSVAKGDLWRLRGLLEMLAEGRRTLPGLEAEGREEARRLADEADYLYETVDNAFESVLSLIDLHINVAAHDTNRFMRLVAIMSTLGLIPAIFGGLLGMNLVEAPWAVTLGQVAFVTLMLILVVLYTFMAKGWLR